MVKFCLLYWSQYNEYGMETSQPHYTQLTSPLHSYRQSEDHYHGQERLTLQLHISEDSQTALEDFLPTSAEDLLDDPALRPLGIEPMPPVEVFCSTSLFESSTVGSPLSSTSLLNTPVPTPGKLTAMTALETVDETSSESTVSVVEQQPTPTTNPNDACVKKVIVLLSEVV